ncbi:unnamed protein product [Callosobruchus maculatus]|uniref:AMP-dependent synthetase/ligase domain-containing protein n=1 Tax=Callosobruchus maculatus TaxID=64391 RepID=A0A653D0K7_CALMS|nr:unnamed protein product [Callosobruchus maculatus]
MMMRIVARYRIFKKICHKNPTRHKSTSITPFFEYGKLYGPRVALCDQHTQQTYENIFKMAMRLSRIIDRRLPWMDKENIGFLCQSNSQYLIMLWAIWMSGHTAVPLNPQHPDKLLHYFASNSKSRLLMTVPEYAPTMVKIAAQCGASLYVAEGSQYDDVDDLDDEYNKLRSRFGEDNNCLILYTSGTTGNPKGVVLTYKNLWASMQVISDMWKFSSSDVVLNILPLNHIYGIAYALLTPLYIGAATVMLPNFSSATIWQYFLGRKKEKITVFMGTPAIYAKLVDKYEKTYTKYKDKVRDYVKSHVRLMVSGSAPLPVSLHRKWYHITGHKILVRYGMTEIGMAMTNEYTCFREADYVGIPPVGMGVCLVNPIKNDTVCLKCTNQDWKLVFDNDTKTDVQGELWVKGDSVFKEYFNDPKGTEKKKTIDGWFKTGDFFEYSVHKKKFRFVGRLDVDIIKSSCYKTNTLQIESRLLAHPKVEEVTVMSVKDEKFGERIAAMLVPKPGANVSLGELRDWCSECVPKDSLPYILKIVKKLPRSALEKKSNEVVKED